jgi:uncharacterized protein
MTDGPDQLAHTVSTIEFLARSSRMPEMIVVAIVNTDRKRDLTPTKWADPEVKQAVADGGGADKFLQFIETELIPQVEKSYRTQPYRVFAGHSMGGLLAIHAFATKNDLFNAYLAVSPSLWWDNQLAIRETKAFFKGRKELKSTVFITLGDEQGGMRSGFEKMKALLSQQHLEGFVWDSLLMEDENHGTVVLRSHYFGLQKIFDGWDPGQATRAAGMPAIEEHFRKLSAKFGFPARPPEVMLNSLAYRLLGAGKNDEAIAVFQKNVECHPISANAYDSLAEGYEKTGKLDLAKQNYEHAVQIGEKNNDPNLPMFRTNFRRVSKILIDGKAADK